MQALPTHIDTRTETYRTNRDGFLEQISYLNDQLALARAGGGEKYVERHAQRGKLIARERVELLLDRDSPFLEIAPLCGWGTAWPPRCAATPRPRASASTCAQSASPSPSRCSSRSSAVVKMMMGRAAESGAGKTGISPRI
jgi:hypothetical protein